MQYDLDVQRLFGMMSDDNKIDCINFIFGSNIPHGSKVVWLNRKSVENSTLEADIVLQIGDDTYHMEVESNFKDTTIGIRILKYGVRIGGQHGDKRDVEIRLPQQVVVYLRTPPKPWHTLTTTLVLPDSQKVTYEVPCKYVSELAGAELVQQAFVFAPAMLVDLIGKKGSSEVAAESFTLIKSNADKMLDERRISGSIYKQILETTAEYAGEVVQKDETIDDKGKEWDKIMEAVGYVEPGVRLAQRLDMWAEESIRAHGEACGEARGAAWGLSRGARIASRLARGRTPEQVATELGVSVERVLDIAKEIEQD
ncbi:hypothetical protein FACS1894217_02140 [Clostridia bacterium]|nr:hypothetical protein FACS1894217_02140 [Clostridia bacterium]